LLPTAFTILQKLNFIHRTLLYILQTDSKWINFFKEMRGNFSEVILKIVITWVRTMISFNSRRRSEGVKYNSLAIEKLKQSVLNLHANNKIKLFAHLLVRIKRAKKQWRKRRRKLKFNFHFISLISIFFNFFLLACSGFWILSKKNLCTMRKNWAAEETQVGKFIFRTFKVKWRKIIISIWIFVYVKS
jgi:hypothetical protein